MPLLNGCGHNVGVIGTINKDTIFSPEGAMVESWGGILYNLKILSEFPELSVYPAVNIGRDCYPHISDILRRFKNVDSRLIRIVDEKNNHCFLTYLNQSTKSEILRGGVPPLRYKDISGLLESDMVLLNFISGRDIGLRALEKFRREYSGVIYIDLHSLTLGRKRSPTGVVRFMRRPRLWRRYVSCADILQVNRAEFELLSCKPFSVQNALKFYGLLQSRPAQTSCLIVTLGEDGCLLIKSEGKTTVVSLPAKPVLNVSDTTGCGDIFSGGFIGEYLATGDLVAAAQSGLRYAAKRCQMNGPMF